MSTFYASTVVHYERAGKRHAIVNVLLIDSPDSEQAADVANDFLNETYPSPAYFNHNFETEALDGIEFTEGEEGSSLLVLSVAEFTINTPREGNT